MVGCGIAIKISVGDGSGNLGPKGVEGLLHVILGRQMGRRCRDEPDEEEDEPEGIPERCHDRSRVMLLGLSMGILRVGAAIHNPPTCLTGTGQKEDFPSMRLTVEENPEAIKRFGYIKPGPKRGGPICSAQCPGTIRTCTLVRGHAGIHVAHGRFGKILAVWDKKAKAQLSVRSTQRRVQSPTPRKKQGLGLLEALDGVRKQLFRRELILEEGFFLVLALFIVVYFVGAILGWIPLG
jgi:hypothetical protein